MKICSRCKSEKDDSDFRKCPHHSDGLHSWCRKCAREAARLLRLNDPTRPKAAVAKWRNKNPNWEKQHYIDIRKRNPEKLRARGIVTQLVFQGRMTRLPCETCGNPLTHAHHDDYDKPLEVRWLCAKHHGELHRKVA